MITWGLLRGFAVGAGVMLVLAACQASGDVTPTPSAVRPTEVSTSPTVTASSTPTSSVSVDSEAWTRVPKAARAHTFAGAQAFAEFYVGQINKAWTVPDPDLLRPYGLPSCKSCANYVSDASEFRDRGQRYAHEPLSVVAGTWLPESTQSLALVSIVWAQRATQITSSDGGKVEAIPSGKGISEFELRWLAPG